MHKYAHISIINMWTNYGAPRLHDNRKTDLITKT